MPVCRLDILPVELVNELFSHFSAHEILSTFSHVSSYLDDVLLTYRSYRVNFQSISRTNFDLVCQHIRPDRVLSLVLSDDQNTPGLVELFLDRFRINQFTDLQSLTLIDIGPEFWDIIITQLVQLKNLRSFVYSALNRSNEWVSNLSREEIIQLDRRLFDSYAPILPHLSRLNLQHGDYLRSVDFSSLQHLRLNTVSADILEHLSINASQLKSLRVSLSGIRSASELIYPFPQLNRLELRIRGETLLILRHIAYAFHSLDITVPMADLERMLSHIPRLERLALIADCTNDVVDGHRWEMKVKDLHTFDFKFHLTRQVAPQDFDSFRTSFWLDKKHWFVAYLNRCFYSVPCHNIREANDVFRCPLFSTVPDTNLFCEHIDSLSLSDGCDEIEHYFPHVQTLTLLRPILLPSLKRVVDLRRVHDLVLLPAMDAFSIASLLNEMPNLSKISMVQNTASFMETIHHERFERIHTLETNRLSDDTEHFMKRKLSAIFPNVEHLHIKSSCSAMDIFACLDQFKRLSTASFRYVSSIETEEDVQNDRFNMKSALDQARQQQKFQYTYRFDCFTVHLWL